MVDDERENLEYMERALRAGFSVTSAMGGAEALAQLEAQHFAVVVSDHRMPEMTGVELLRQVRDRWPNTQRLVVTAYADLEATIDAINRAHVDGYLKKPLGKDEIVTAINTAVELYELKQQNQALMRELEHKNAELMEKERLLELSLDDKSRELLRVNKHLEQMVVRDGLTGLYNHRYFQERIEDEVRRARRYNLNLALVFCDIDNFKRYNDANGHPMGDQALIDVARILANGRTALPRGIGKVRETDIVARYGGEEFVILLPETDKPGAAVMAERVRLAVEGHRFPGADTMPGGKLTVSVGVAAYPSDAQSRGELIERADQALYRAKSLGKNRVALYS